MRIPESLREQVAQVEEDSGYTFTEHAVKRMWERRSAPEWVIKVIHNFDATIPGVIGDRTYTRGWGRLSTGRRLYVCLAHDDPYVIISTGWRDRYEEDDS